VPSYRPGRHAPVRIEYRQPDPACNPYLTFVAILTAGLAGIEGKYEPVAPNDSDVALMSGDERAAHGIESLPASPYQALVLAEHSEVRKQALGEHTYPSLQENKRGQRSTCSPVAVPEWMDRDEVDVREAHSHDWIHVIRNLARPEGEDRMSRSTSPWFGGVDEPILFCLRR
jgi:hypothetical protein